jgi:hypothetical protein
LCSRLADTGCCCCHVRLVIWRRSASLVSGFFLDLAPCNSIAFSSNKETMSHSELEQTPQNNLLMWTAPQSPPWGPDASFLASSAAPSVPAPPLQQEEMLLPGIPSGRNLRDTAVLLLWLQSDCLVSSRGVSSNCVLLCLHLANLNDDLCATVPVSVNLNNDFLGKLFRCSPRLSKEGVSRLISLILCSWTTPLSLSRVMMKKHRQLAGAAAAAAAAALHYAQMSSISLSRQHLISIALTVFKASFLLHRGR